MVDVPTAPKVNDITNKTASSFYFSFSAPIDDGGAKVTDYYIQQADNFNFDGASTFSGAPPGVTVSGLYRAKQYWVRVRCRNSKGYSPWSVALSTTTLALPPSATNPYYIDAQGQTGIHYLFNGVNDDGGSPVREYQVGYGTDPNNVQASFNLGSGDAWINGLNRYTLYYVWSRARNDIDWGPWSVRYEQRTRAYVPAPPSPTALDNVTQTSLHYTFRGEDNGGADILEWQVGWGTDPNNIQNTVSSNGDTTITGLSPYTTYYIWSRGRNVEGWGAWSARTQTRTIAGAKVRTNDGAFHDAIPYVKENGSWKLARPYVKRVGLWKLTE